MDSNIPSCGMGKTIVQSAYQKCLELHDFVPIFLKFSWGRTPRKPPSAGHFNGQLAAGKRANSSVQFSSVLEIPPFSEEHPKW